MKLKCLEVINMNEIKEGLLKKKILIVDSTLGDNIARILKNEASNQGLEFEIEVKQGLNGLTNGKTEYDACLIYVPDVDDLRKLKKLKKVKRDCRIYRIGLDGKIVEDEEYLFNGEYGIERAKGMMNYEDIVKDIKRNGVRE
jgi:hypothetical protein